MKKLLPDIVVTAINAEKLHKRKFGVYPNIFFPKTFNEKIHCRMLYDRRAILTLFVDKYLVRKYVKEKIGEEALTKLYHVTNNPSDIPFDDLPNRYVVKPNHGSGWIYLVDDNQKVNRQDVIASSYAWLRSNYYDIAREWAYKNISPCILVEEFISDGTGKVPLDYKLYVFAGRVEFIHVDVGRFEDHRRNLYDRSWNKISVELEHKNADIEIAEPKQLATLVRYAEKLGEGLDFIRVDLYHTKDKVYFGEITTTPGGGLDVFVPSTFDQYAGTLWDLSLSRRRVRSRS